MLSAKKTQEIIVRYYTYKQKKENEMTHETASALATAEYFLLELHKYAFSCIRIIS
jgi:hypothetical protein